MKRSVKSTAALIARKRRRFPIGKAFSRAGFRNIQRGVAPTKRTGVRLSRDRRTALRLARLHLSAANATRRMAPGFLASAGTPTWRPLGPSHIPHGQTYGSAKPAVSGRCVGVSVDPQDPRVIILCSAEGGLWRTVDGASSWQPLTDEQPLLSMGALARAPSAPHILYAATGEGDNAVGNSVGLLRSSDGGASWTLVESRALLGTAVYDLAVHPRDPLRLWVACMDGLYSSRDGGATCRRERAAQCWSISVNPRDPGEILAATAEGLLRSGDGGSTWSLQTLAGSDKAGTLSRMEACHAPSNPGVVFVAAAYSTTRDDGSEHGEARLWSRAAKGGAYRACNPPSGMDVSQSWYDWCLAVAPDDPTQVYWGAIELYRGRLGGTGRMSWSNIASRRKGDSIHPDLHHLAFDPSDPAVLLACSDGGLFRSPDRGGSWVSLNPGLAITEFEFIAHHAAGSPASLMGGTQDNGTLELRGAGEWQQVGLGDGGDCAIADATGGTVQYHSYYYMSLERRPLVGGRWSDVTPTPVRANGNAYDDGTPYPCLFYPPMDAYGDAVAQAGHTLFVSADRGENWTEIRLPGLAAEDMASTLAFASETLVVLGTVNGAAFRVQRGNSGWAGAKVTALTSPRKGFLSDVHILDARATRMWVSCSRIGGGHVFRSDDGGMTWNRCDGNLPDTPVNALVSDPADPRRLFVATDHGVFETRDGGGAWRGFSNGLPNAVIGDLIVHPGSRLLRAGTRARGAWEVGI